MIILYNINLSYVKEFKSGLNNTKLSKLSSLDINTLVVVGDITFINLKNKEFFYLEDISILRFLLQLTDALTSIRNNSKERFSSIYNDYEIEIEQDGNLIRISDIQTISFKKKQLQLKISSLLEKLIKDITILYSDMKIDSNKHFLKLRKDFTP